jgi:hypothetical protein
VTAPPIPAAAKQTTRKAKRPSQGHSGTALIAGLRAHDAHAAKRSIYPSPRD